MARIAQVVGASRSSTLPLQLSSFVGRAVDLRLLHGLVGGHRLVTVLGPGGSGKTRVALELAGQLADRFDGGVRLVELASVSDPLELPAIVAASLGLQEQPGLSTTESLLQAVAGRQLMIVLDNCEHVIESAAALCVALLGASADLRIVATSREPLRIPSEARYPLPPLQVPGLAPELVLAEYEAVALFVARAQQVDPGFTLDESTQEAVGEIVQRLDGMPLAIELAAARVGGLGVDQVRDRLDDRFRLLVDGPRGAAPRQQSLQAAIDWSYRLLTDTEARVFRYASGFPGPFSTEDAQAVAGREALDVAPALVERSLLVLSHSSPDGRTRFGMLETLRAYGADRLTELAETREVSAALADWAVEAAQRARSGFYRSAAEERAAAQWVDAEYENLHQALEWSLDHDPLAALHLAAALGPWWHLRGRYSEGRSLLERGLAACRASPTPLRAEALIVLGRLAYAASDYPAGLELCTHAVDLLTPSGPSRLLVDALLGRSSGLRNTLHLINAEEEAQRALHSATAIGYAGGRAEACAAVGFAALYAADYQRAHRWATQSQSEDEAAIRPYQARHRQALLAAVAGEVGDDAIGEVACRRGLALAQQAGDRASEAWHLSVLAEYLTQSRRISEAAQCLMEALQTFSDIGATVDCLECLAGAALVLGEAGRDSDSLLLFAAAEAAWQAGAFGVARMHSEGVAASRRRSIRQLPGTVDPVDRQNLERRGARMPLTAALEQAAASLQAIAAPLTPRNPDLSPLSPRERELVTLLAAGLTDKQIAEKMFISIRTVRSHLDRIRDKTGSRRRAELTRLAIDTNLV